jgi:hypothetical protein
MARPAALPVMPRKRGNPNWGKPFRPGPVFATEFELQVKRLRLTQHTYTSSVELWRWCQLNRNRRHIPEWLRDAWGIAVDSTPHAPPSRPAHPRATRIPPGGRAVAKSPQVIVPPPVRLTG